MQKSTDFLTLDNVGFVMSIERKKGYIRSDSTFLAFSSTVSLIPSCRHIDVGYFWASHDSTCSQMANVSQHWNSCFVEASWAHNTTSVKMPKQFCVKHTVDPSSQNELVMQGVACIHSTLCASGSQQGSECFDVRILYGPPGPEKTLIGKCIVSTSHATFFAISASALIAAPCSLWVTGMTPVGPTV